MGTCGPPATGRSATFIDQLAKGGPLPAPPPPPLLTLKAQHEPGFSTKRTYPPGCGKRTRAWPGTVIRWNSWICRSRPKKPATPSATQAAAPASRPPATQYHRRRGRMGGLPCAPGSMSPPPFRVDAARRVEQVSIHVPHDYDVCGNRAVDKRLAMAGVARWAGASAGFAGEADLAG